MQEKKLKLPLTCYPSHARVNRVLKAASAE
jgi:hypothetical protein